MKFAFMTFSTPEWELSRILEFCRRTGYDGFEPRLDSGHAHGIETDASPEQRRTIRRQAEDNGIAICCLATSVQLLKPGEAEAQKVLVQRSLELAHDVGAPALRIFGSGEGPIEDGDFAARHIEPLAARLSELAPLARAAGVRLCLETHDYWTDSRILREVLLQAGDPWVGANWDAMHPLRVHGISVSDSYQHLKPWIYHAHMHAGRENPDAKPPFTFLPLGHPDDQFQAREMQEIAQQDGFSGFFSGEWLNQWSDPDSELPRELATARSWEQEIKGG